MPRDVVAFDLDGTLVSNDSFVPFLLRVIYRRPGCWVRSWSLPFAYLWHKLGQRDNSWLKIYFLKRIVGGLPCDQLQALGETYARELRSSFRAAALEQINHHKAQGDFIVLATASPDVYVDPLAKLLEFDLCVCTRLAEVAGQFTGELVDGNCYGDNKLVQIKRALLARDYHRIDVAYSDHHADLPLLLDAQKPVVVSPSSKFEHFCAAQNFEISRWD
ncbi:MAG: HAD-IB family hydrolase [Pseudomonadota bacterium]